jgi:glucose-6-phosphate isomerase
MAPVTATSTWAQLTQHYAQEGQSIDMRKAFQQNPHRSQTMSTEFQAANIHMLLDYSKNIINEKTLELLFQLVKEMKLPEMRDAMFSGREINFTEQRAVLHVALRNMSNTPILVQGKDVMPAVNHVKEHMRQFADQVRSGKWVGYTGKKITDIVNIGIGGSDLGPYMVTEALRPYGARDMNVHFVSNIDGTHLANVLSKVHPETTLFIIASKTFTTQETITNAKSAKAWFLQQAKNVRHCILWILVLHLS